MIARVLAVLVGLAELLVGFLELVLGVGPIEEPPP